VEGLAILMTSSSIRTLICARLPDNVGAIIAANPHLTSLSCRTRFNNSDIMDLAKSTSITSIDLPQDYDQLQNEAFSALINFAFKEVGFERITGRHHVDNSASGRVMEKCGLQYEGTLRKIHRINTGSLVDCKYYSILKEEYVD
jgi:hypothetical protein